MVAKKAVKKNTIRQRMGFRVNERIVYPTQGVGVISEIKLQQIVDLELEMFVIKFEKDRLVMRVPVHKAKSVGMRKLSDQDIIDAALKTLRGRARTRRAMWSRRSQEYEAKINSGDLVSIAEVVRDLYRSKNKAEQSYSERQLYAAAFEKICSEIMWATKISLPDATELINDNLAVNKSSVDKGEGSEDDKSDETTIDAEKTDETTMDVDKADADEGESHDEAGRDQPEAA